MRMGAPFAQHKLCPEGFCLLAFYATVQVLRCSDGEWVGEFPKPYKQMNEAEWKEIVVKAIQEGGKVKL